jgi:hypothetical protein
LPKFATEETARILQEFSPVAVDIGHLLAVQQDYHQKAVRVDGSVGSSVNVDETDQATVATWFFEMIPKTVTTNSSSTYFYLDDGQGNMVLVKYPADLDLSLDDKVAVTGFFNAHTVVAENKYLWATKKEQVLSVLGEPFVSALIVENDTKQKVEYIRRQWSNDVGR